MTNPEIIAAVERWQADPRLHSLTCRDHNLIHAPLVPVEKAGSVILECPSCGYCELNIPEAVFVWDGNLAGFITGGPHANP